jgi:hypothetical protein
MVLGELIKTRLCKIDLAVYVLRYAWDGVVNGKCWVALSNTKDLSKGLKIRNCHSKIEDAHTIRHHLMADLLKLNPVI